MSLINVFHGSCTLKSVELLLSSAKIFLFYLINILQFYNLNKYLLTRTNILLGSIHKFYNLIDVFVLLSKQVVKNDNFSSVSMYYSSLNILSTFPINNIELHTKHFCVEIYSYQ